MNESKYPGFVYVTNTNGNEFVYSGFSGLIMDNNEYIDECINEPEKADQEIYSYLFDDPFLSLDIPFFEEEPEVKALTVFVTNQCNLNCSHCSLLDIQTFKDGINYFLVNFKHGNSVNIQFLGGEPLLNFSFIKDAVDFLKKAGKNNNFKFTYSITTNGTLLNRKEIQDFLICNNFNVTVSIDGEEVIHKGSDKIIAENIKELSRYINIVARVTIPSPDIDYIKLYENLRDIGANEVTMELVAQKKDSDAMPSFIRMKDFADYFIEHIKNKDLIQFKNYIDILKSIHFGSRKSPKYFPCSAGISYYSFNSDGDIYPCHRFNGSKQQKWGNIYESFDNDSRKEFLSKHMVFLRDSGKCMECWARYLCGGICYNTSLFTKDDTYKISQVHCDFTREIIKNSLYIYASLEDEERVVFQNLP